MSYILDALKKADSERQHGKTPDIYSPQPSSDALDNEESARNKPIVWILSILIVLLCAFLIFINLYRTPPAVTLPPAPIAAAPIPPAPPIAPAVQSTPVAPAPVVEPAVVVPAAAAPTPPPTAVAESPIAADQPAAEPVKLQPSAKLSIPAAKEKRHASASASSTSKKPSVTKEADLSVETVSTTFRDLPLNIQNEIPTVTVGGYIYSTKREECQLLINKLILHEGEQVAPGLMLERMMP
ncbi:MAG: hypothetical protein ACXU7H_01585, partial [Burkholderiaceae bacterium]